MDRHDLGLPHDLRTLAATMQRRRARQCLAALGGASLLGCGGGGDASAAASTTASGTTTTTTGSSTTCSIIPEETAGPYPGDGSNGVNALALSGIVRSDIRSSFAGATGVADGVPLTVRLTLVNAGASCADLAGYAIYLWHCDRLGRYSLYSTGVTAENYLRGVQATDAAGVVPFTSIYPGCYSGRMPHLHFEVYRSVDTATAYGNKLKTSQVAFPVDVSAAVYATSAYASSATNFSGMSNANDMVFSDGVTLQQATLTGSVTEGYVAALAVGIAG
jgi:protocatechuate 3,4-dioxygenase beta subunit